MRKYFLLVLIFSIISFIFFGIQQKALAASTTYTWSGNSINMLGSQIDINLPYDSVPALGNTNLIYYGSNTPTNILDPQSSTGSCSMYFYVTVNPGGHSGVTLAYAPKTSPCPQNIIDQYNKQTVTIGGTPPAVVATNDETVEITYGSLNSGTVTFTFTQQNCTKNCTTEVTVTQPATADCATVTQYKIDTKLALGTYKLTAPNFLPQTFTKRPGLYSSEFFDKGVTPSMGGGTTSSSISISLVAGPDQKGPYTFTINGNVNPSSVQTTVVKNSGNGTAVNCSNQTASFCNVPPGTYSICIKGLQIACQTVTKTAGTDGSVIFNAASIDQNATCQVADLSETPVPSLPPPPSPPCMTWVNGECTQFASGLGIFSTEPENFIQTIFAIILSTSGGIAILLIIRAGYQLMISRGKPEQIKEGRDQLIAAIVGLLFLIFSFVFLQLIGVDLLHIPGFSAGTAAAPGTCNPSQCVNSTECTTVAAGTGSKCTTTGCPNGQSCILGNTSSNPPAAAAPAAPAPAKPVTHNPCGGANSCPNGQTCTGYNAQQCAHTGTSCTGTCN